MKANPAPLVDWYKEDVRIQDGGRFVKDTDGLLIQNVTAEDDGIYKCRAIVLDTGNIQDRDIRVEVCSYYNVAIFIISAQISWYDIFKNRYEMAFEREKWFFFFLFYLLIAFVCSRKIAKRISYSVQMTLWEGKKNYIPFQNFFHILFYFYGVFVNFSSLYFLNIWRIINWELYSLFVLYSYKNID